MTAIRITKCAQHPDDMSNPGAIRSEWLNLEVPVLSDKDAHEAEQLTGGVRPKEQYFYVRGTDAIKAFLTAGKKEAAHFWNPEMPPPYICFPKNCAEIIQR